MVSNIRKKKPKEGVNRRKNTYLGYKNYELKNHLGNVMATITDRKQSVHIQAVPLVVGDFTRVLSHYQPEVVSISDYYPYHSLLPGRNFNSSEYRYGGANGQEKTDEISGVGNHYTAEFWEYNSRLGRRWNLDPVVVSWESPYAAFRNNPIVFSDPNGDCPDCEDGNYEVQKGDTYWDLENNWGMDHGTLEGLNPGVEPTKLQIGQSIVTNSGSKENSIPYSWQDNPSFSVAVLSLEASAGAGPSVGANINSTTPIPEQSIFWEGGSSLLFGGIGFGASSPGADVSGGAGNITFSSTHNTSLISVLNEQSVTIQTGFIGPLGVGGKYSRTESDGYSMNLFMISYGTPGAIRGTSTNDMGLGFVYTNGLKNKQDSIKRALEGERYHPNSHFTQYLNNNSVKRSSISAPDSLQLLK